MRAHTALIIMAAVLGTTARVYSSYDAPITTPIISADDGPMAIAAAMRQGAEDATRDIKAGIFRILLLDIVWQDQNAAPVRDRETGYPFFSVPACEATAPFLAAVEAYNEVMKKWQADHK